MKTTQILIALIFCLASLAARADLRNTIIISDIDDTIQHTQVRPADESASSRMKHVLHLAKNVVKNHDAFVGMSHLYMMLVLQGAKIHYVSGAPKSIIRIPEKFLQTSGFPDGELHVRPDPKVRTALFKFEKISEILDANPDKRVILIGDNGEKDVTVYNRLSTVWRFKDRVDRVYIHDLYPEPIGENLAPKQRPYLTAADLAMQFMMDGILTSNQVLQIAELVRQGMDSKFSSIRERAYPDYATLRGKSFNSLDAQALTIRDRRVRSVMLKIMEQIFERYESKQPARQCMAIF